MATPWPSTEQPKTETHVQAAGRCSRPPAAGKNQRTTGQTEDPRSHQCRMSIKGWSLACHPPCDDHARRAHVCDAVCSPRTVALVLCHLERVTGIEPQTQLGKSVALPCCHLLIRRSAGSGPTDREYPWALFPSGTLRARLLRLTRRFGRSADRSSRPR